MAQRSFSRSKPPAKALKLMERYGFSSLSFSTLDSRLKKFSLPDIPGYITYARSGKTLVALGDTICSEENALRLVSGFIRMAKKNGRRFVFFASTARFSRQMARAGLHRVKVAEDASFSVPNFTLKGNRMANVRRGRNRARNAGLEFLEYSPLKKRDPRLERECTLIARDWKNMKKTPPLAFILGRLDWSRMDRKRVFVAKGQKRIEGFLVYNPVFRPDGKKDWYLDLVRRRPDAVNGTIDYLIVKSVECFKKENVKRFYLGMVPDVGMMRHLKKHEASLIGGKLLSFFAKRFNAFYPVDRERFFKEKYHPQWTPLYLYYSGKVTFPKMYDVFRAFIPGGLMKIFSWRLLAKREK